MSGDVPAAADVTQAEYFRGFLEQERSELAARLAAQTRRLTECMTLGALTPISHMRHAIRISECDLRVIDRMVDALNGRFPEVSDVRRPPWALSARSEKTAVP